MIYWAVNKVFKIGARLMPLEGHHAQRRQTAEYYCRSKEETAQTHRLGVRELLEFFGNTVYKFTRHLTSLSAFYNYF